MDDMPDQTTDTDRDERVRRKAYEIWEQEGSPEGRQLHHWHAAERAIDGASPAIREGLDATDSEALAANPDDPDAKLDVGLDESFPASDPPAGIAPATRPRRATKAKSPLTDPGSPGGTSGTGGTANDQDR